MFAGKYDKLCQCALPKFLFHWLGCFCLWDRLVTHHGSRVGQRDRVGHIEWFAVYQSCGSSGVSRRCSYSLSLIASFNDRGRPITTGVARKGGPLLWSLSSFSS